MPAPAAPKPVVMHVMAGVLLDAEGRVLLAQRPPGKHLAGMWEFPGGKLEPGEVPLAALARELHEELGINLQRAAPLIRVPRHYVDRELLLDTWQVDQWEGVPQSREGQALQWLLPAQVDPAILTLADRAILQALRLPPRYPITPSDVSPDQRGLWFERIGHAIVRGERMLQLRLPLWPRELVRELAAALLPLARRHDTQLLLHGDVEGARSLGIGVHLRSTQLSALSERPLPLQQLVGASCHDAAHLAQASRVEADFATLSPVAATPSHPQTSPLGWPRFQSLAEAASLPVYALGGAAPLQIAQARQHSGQGVAGMREFWP
ncbi:Nudix family hydrolase [Rhodanobacter sp. C03]|uniref:Nudix family hydrolase n=1 Tax=Rhodanobacter sp. C03 TaxID=1945858 RepID=UPI0009D2A096|nr:Nudix family hydrolase [Rhodanobacter sp. C03]OOG59653.1 thiamine monophosphate synthase [Rhodanobacter sp. C03]